MDSSAFIQKMQGGVQSIRHACGQVEGRYNQLWLRFSEITNTPQLRAFQTTPLMNTAARVAMVALGFILFPFVAVGLLLYTGATIFGGAVGQFLDSILQARSSQESPPKQKGNPLSIPSSGLQQELHEISASKDIAADPSKQRPRGHSADSAHEETENTGAHDPDNGSPFAVVPNSEEGGEPSFDVDRKTSVQTN